MSMCSRLRWSVTAGLLTASLASTTAQADAGWTDYGRVQELVPTSKHYFEVRIDAPGNRSGCDTPNGYYQNYVANGSQQMFAVLQDALKADLAVRVYVTGVCNINGYAEISAVGVVP